MSGIFLVCCFVLWVRIGAGLPNITGAWQGTLHTEGAGSSGFEGAITPGSYSRAYSYAAISSATSKNNKKILDASLSNSIYGSSETVSPLSQSTLYLVKY